MMGKERYVVGGVLAAVIGLWTMLAAPFWLFTSTTGIVLAISTLGLLVLVGWAREVSLSQAGLTASAIYLTAYAMRGGAGLDWPFLPSAALGIGAAVDTPATLMSRGDYAQGKKAIEGETRLAFARCRGESGSARDICKAEVRAAERVKMADLQARYHGTVAAAEDARLARAKAQFEVARARCGVQSGEARVDCLRSAREDRTRALEQAKLAST